MQGSRYNPPTIQPNKETKMFNIDKQQVLDAFHHRRATRAYDPSKKISPDDFAYILELARLSPSSIGSEPWQFLVV